MEPLRTESLPADRLPGYDALPRPELVHLLSFGGLPVRVQSVSLQRVVKVAVGHGVLCVVVARLLGRVRGVLAVVQLSVNRLLVVYEVVEADLSPAVILRGNRAALVLVLDDVVSGLRHCHFLITGELVGLRSQLLHVIVELLDAREVCLTLYSPVHLPHREIALHTLVVDGLVGRVFYFYHVSHLTGIRSRCLLLAQGDHCLGGLA